MKRTLSLIFLLLLPCWAMGCSLCCGPFDYDYPTFGGKHQRVNPKYGRVGSVFSDPLASYGDQGPDSVKHVPNRLDEDDQEREQIFPDTPGFDNETSLPLLEDLDGDLDL